MYHHLTVIKRVKQAVKHVFLLLCCCWKHDHTNSTLTILTLRKILSDSIIDVT